MTNAKEIENLIRDLIEKMALSVNKISIDDEKPETLRSSGKDSIWFGVEIKEPHLFWERGGEALNALNHLVRRIIESKNPKVSENPETISSQTGLGIVIDINGFQKKKIENIHSVAHMMAERARYFKSNIEIDPMPAFERRIIHEFLSDATDLKTESQGEGYSRRVVIKYVGSI